MKPNPASFEGENIQQNQFELNSDVSQTSSILFDAAYENTRFEPSKESEIQVASLFDSKPLRKTGRSSFTNVVYSSINRRDLGNYVHKDAPGAGWPVPDHQQCTSTLSDQLIQAGLMNPRDYLVRVKDMEQYLAKRFGSPRNLRGNFNINDIPNGFKGIISGTNHVKNGSNHIAYVERRGNSVLIVHNKNGKVVQENINRKFFSASGRPKYRNMKLFRLR